MKLSQIGHEEDDDVIVLAGTFKSWKVWKVKFRDGKKAVLFKCGNAWMQRNEDTLDRALLNDIGKKIDSMG